MAQIYTANEIMPTEAEIQKILEAKLSCENAKKTKSDDDFQAWCKSHFNIMPWGISYKVSIGNKRLKNSKPMDVSLRYFIIAIAIDWPELIDNLKRTLKNWGYNSAELKQMATDVWQDQSNANLIANAVAKVYNSDNLTLTESVEKHSSLNTKLFTKEEMLKDRVRDKMLEIVDEFLADLKEQDVKIKVDDILLIGSNASYNYTKNSDIDLHIVANTKAVEYSAEVSAALYGAYRTLFNKQLDIQLFDIPVEIFVESEDSERISNGVYSVKKNKWLKKPVHEDIPDYDKDALNKLVSKWEEKCKELIDDIKADKLDDEKKVVKLLEDIYEKLRKKGVAKSEYSIENLAFKELRNKGYLDTLKDSRNDLVSKRLSLEERLSRQQRNDIYRQLTRITNSRPIIQDNGVFYVYNLKATEVESVVSKLRKLPFVREVSAHENGKYDFSDTLQLAINKIPNKYYDIRGKIDENLI
jgi:predicted nucleotidyltransferase